MSELENSLKIMEDNRSLLRTEWEKLSGNIDRLIDRHGYLQQQENQELQQLQNLREELQRVREENTTKGRDIEALNKRIEESEEEQQKITTAKETIKSKLTQAIQQITTNNTEIQQITKDIIAKNSEVEQSLDNEVIVLPPPPPPSGGGQKGGYRYKTPKNRRKTKSKSKTRSKSKSKSPSKSKKSKKSRRKSKY